MTTMPVDRGFYITSGFGARDGGFHWGTDFGHDGGSGDYPVYAIRSGTVAFSGPASGFGFWVCVDHPAEVGGGFSVYGHTIPEVEVGQWVEEGQRIAHINPDSNTNGGYPPHLHLEFHRYTWVGPGPDRLDPESILSGARWPNEGGTSSREDNSHVTIFGVDVSEHQNGMSLSQAKAEGMSFAIIRTTDGTYRDFCYRSHLEDAESAGMLTCAYHFVRNPAEGTSIREQVDAALDVMGDARRPIWLDCETEHGLSVNHIRETKALFEAAGIRVIGAYSYVPYWEHQIFEGEPDSHEFGHLWVAAYPSSRVDSPAALYPGDGAGQWSYPLGNQLPVLWQFASSAAVAGRQVDVNAFRGTIDELRSIFYGESTQQRGQIAMALLEGESAAALNDAKLAAQGAEMEVSEPIQSIINPSKSFAPRTLLALIDSATWMNHQLLLALCADRGLNPVDIIQSAIEKDNQ